MKNLPLSVVQFQDDRLGKSRGEGPAIIRGSGRRAFAGRQRNGRREQSDMLLVKLVRNFAEALESLFHRS